MKWLLLVYIAGHRIGSFGMAEFSSEIACEQAKAVVVEWVADQPLVGQLRSVRAICVEVPK